MCVAGDVLASAVHNTKIGTIYLGKHGISMVPAQGQHAK